jgi:putative DNA-invertase from lambdoid prophage Rac
VFHVYARVSTMEQAAEDRVSITEQVRRCRAVASMRGIAQKYELREYKDEGVSGSVPLYKRPAGKYMLERANKGDVICASKLDRIFRSASDALSTVERLKKKGIGLIICDMGVDPVAESPASSFFFGMLGLVAQFERERIHERITEGKVAKKARGGAIGGRTPFGFRKIGEGRSAVLVPDEREREHCFKALEVYDREPVTWRDISAEMEQAGMYGRDGKPYQQMAITRMIERAHEFRRAASAGA